MQRAWDVALVPLVLLAHVEYLHSAFVEQPLQLAELHRLDHVGRPGLGHVARELEETDGLQSARSVASLGLVGRVNDDPLLRLPVDWPRDCS